MASIRKRTWQSGGEEKTAFVADYFDQDGKRHIKTFARKKDADAWLVTTRTEVAEGVHTPERTSVTVAEAAQLWLDRCEFVTQLERGTREMYATHVRYHINPLLGRKKLAQLTKPAIEGFRDALLSTGAPAVNNHPQAPCSRALTAKVLTSLKSLLSAAQSSGLVAQNVATGVRTPVEKRGRAKVEPGVTFPSKHEVTRIIDNANPRWRPILVTAILTGMRSSELRGLAWPNVDFAKKLIRVRQRADHWGSMGEPKSNAGIRDIPMSPLVLNTLKAWKLECPPGKLTFPSGTGKVDLHANITRAFYKLQKATGIVDADGSPKYGFHALRHFFASWAIEQEFSAKKLQALLGHSSISMTLDIYGGLFPDDEKDQAKFAAGELALLAARVLG